MGALFVSGDSLACLNQLIFESIQKNTQNVVLRIDCTSSTLASNTSRKLNLYLFTAG